MKIAVVGTGYVGLVTGTCFAEMGIETTCIDIDSQKIEELNKGHISIYEPGLSEIVLRNLKANRLHFTNKILTAINSVDILFIAVGTPSDDDGRADLSSVYQVANEIGEYLKRDMLVVTKSTVPIGTTHIVKSIIESKLESRGASSFVVDVASNPEFLKEGTAVDDFMHPDRVIVGVESVNARNLMTRLYRPFLLNNFRVIFMDILSSEMSKYASNAMLATRISFMNDIANLCERVGADVNMVRKGLGTDSRIGNKFLYPGCGYGGSCFPKDIKALVTLADDAGYDMKLLRAVEEVNSFQKRVLFEKFTNFFGGDISGKSVAVWGVSFKPETDDIREAPSVYLIEELLLNNINVRVYDPVALNLLKEKLGESVYYASDIYDATLNVDAIIVPTEWKEFRMPNWDVIKKIVNHPLVIDGRNIYTKSELDLVGFTYLGIGQ